MCCIIICTSASVLESWVEIQSFFAICLSGCIGDQILSVNDVSLKGLPHMAVVKLFKEVKGRLVLSVVRRFPRLR